MTESAIGPYQVLLKLGSGGMGEVFLCQDTRLHRRVALKSLNAADTDRGELRERVLREARAAARLNHPHIAAVYDVVEDRDRAFIVMEYVEGENLAAHVARGPLPIERVHAIGQQLANALAAAHAQGVVHRDLKPSNIQIMSDGSVKILDFGVARVASPVTTPTATTVSVPTPSTLRDSAGTPMYMAPEQLVGGQADARSDVYSLGVVLFELATGRRPYLEHDAIALAVAMAKAPAPALKAVDPSLPEKLSAVVARALETDPAKRYQSAAELVAALARANDRPPLGRRLWKPAVAAAALVAIGVAARYGVPDASGPPAVMAILPVDNTGADPTIEHFGASLTSVVTENFGSISGLTTLSRAATGPYGSQRNDLQSLRREVGATYVLDLAMTGSSPQLHLTARLRRPGTSTPIWEQSIVGNPVVVEQGLLDNLGRVVERVVRKNDLSDAEWTRIRKIPTSSPEALLAYSQARALLDRYDMPASVDGAIALLTRAISQDPRFVLAQAALGDALWEKYASAKDPDLATEATDAVMRAARADPAQAAVSYSLGNMAYQRGRLEDAANSLRRSLTLQPDLDDAHRVLGHVLADRGDFEGAIAELRLAIRIRPSFWRHYNSLGLVFYRAGRYRDALDPYRRATELQPSAAGPFQMLGTIYYRLAQFDEAIGNYEHAVRLGPNAAAYANLALGYYARQRYDEALQAYQQSLEVSPKSIGNHRNLGDVYMRLKQPAKAKAAYEDAIVVGNEMLAVNARDFRTIALVALCEAKAGRTADAERHAAEARALAPADREILQRSAEIHARLGDSTAALRYLKAAIDGGYGRHEARDNDEFASLRKLPEFVSVVTEPPDSKTR